jgi:hypothetical protein
MPVKIIITKKVNIPKLIQEFASAGFLQTSSRPDEFIVVEDTDDEKAVMVIYDAHDPTPPTKNPTPEEDIVGMKVQIAELKTRVDALTTAGTGRKL